MIFESLTTQDVAWEGALPGEEGKDDNIDGSNAFIVILIQVIIMIKILMVLV